MKKSAYLLMGFLMVIMVTIGFAACGGNENKQQGNDNSFANFGGDRMSAPAMQSNNDRPASGDDKIVGRWIYNDEYGNNVIVFNRNNSGYAENYYGKMNFSYKYNDRLSEITVAYDDYRNEFETTELEWFGNDRFYILDHGRKFGPFVRQ